MAQNRGASQNVAKNKKRINYQSFLTFEKTNNMTKEEFLALAAQKWEALEKKKDTSDSFYEYEKDFDEVWVDFGRSTLEGTLGKPSLNRRKKNEFKSLRRDTNK